MIEEWGIGRPGKDLPQFSEGMMRCGFHGEPLINPKPYTLNPNPKQKIRDVLSKTWDCDLLLLALHVKA